MYAIQIYFLQSLARDVTVRSSVKMMDQNGITRVARFDELFLE